MIPIRDSQESGSTPVVTYALLGMNALVFLYQLSIGLHDQGFIYRYGLVPGKYTVEEVSAYFSFANLVISLFSYMFLHGGFFHFAGNMLSLYIFGDNVEDHFGSARFLGFYVLCGLVSGGFHFMADPVSRVPTIGASGAIAGVMGAYFLLYPRAKILTVIPIIFIPWFVEIPAFVFLGLWFLLQFLNAAGQGASSIAWWAHIGGFIAGLALVKLNGKLPHTGAGDRIQQFTKRKGTPKLQVIRTEPGDNGIDLYGSIDISSLEALAGTKKLVNIPWGFYNRMYTIKVPAGVKQGTMLRLAGLGRAGERAVRGNLYLKINIKNAV
ncbi:MAG: rhomboid family intramembrane serine protease [Desulfobacteraceae bacterium]